MQVDNFYKSANGSYLGSFNLSINLELLAFLNTCDSSKVKPFLGSTLSCPPSVFLNIVLNSFSGSLYSNKKAAVKTSISTPFLLGLVQNLLNSSVLFLIAGYLSKKSKSSTASSIWSLQRLS